MTPNLGVILAKDTYLASNGGLPVGLVIEDQGRIACQAVDHVAQALGAVECQVGAVPVACTAPGNPGRIVSTGMLIMIMWLSLAQVLLLLL